MKKIKYYLKDCVISYVHDDLAELFGVNRQRRNIVVNMHRKSDITLLGHNFQQGHFTLYNIAEVGQLAVHSECPSLQARDTEKVINQLYHALTR